MSELVQKTFYSFSLFCLFDLIILSKNIENTFVTKKKRDWVIKGLVPEFSIYTNCKWELVTFENSLVTPCICFRPLSLLQEQVWACFTVEAAAINQNWYIRVYFKRHSTQWHFPQKSVFMFIKLGTGPLKTVSVWVCVYS